jgi:hypothetical protein
MEMTLFHIFHLNPSFVMAKCPVFSPSTVFDSTQSIKLPKI